MKYLFPLLICSLLVSVSAISSQVPIGYKNDHVITWRFWEIVDGIPKAKMLVFNIRDSTVEFSMQRTNSFESPGSPGRIAMEREQHLVDTAIIPRQTIPAHGYKVYDIGSSQYCYDLAYVNGKSIGIEDQLEPVKLPAYDHRYYSYNGLLGSKPYLIGKDDLFSKRGKSDQLDLYFDCQRNDINTDPYRLELVESKGMEYLTFCFDDGSCIESNTGSKLKFTINCKSTAVATVHVKYKLAKRSKDVLIDMRRVFNNGSMGVLLPVIVQ